MIVLIVTVFLIPLLWSGLLILVRRLMQRNDDLRDSAEKTFLALLLAPVLVGAGLAAVARFIHVSVPIPVRPFVEGMARPVAVQAQSHVGTAPHFDALSYLPGAVVWAYAAVTAVLVLKLVLAALGMARISRRAQKRDDLGAGILTCDAAIPPLAWGVGRILLPRSLTLDLTPAQIALVIRHEREHLRRRDPLYFWLLSLIDALFWFNPFVRAQTKRCRLAAELACDAAVTSAMPTMRKAYAETLVMVLKHAAGSVRQYAPAAFSPVKSGDNHMRISHIMRPPEPGRKPRSVALYVAAAVLILPMVATQLALAQPGQSDKGGGNTTTRVVGDGVVIDVKRNENIGMKAAGGKSLSGGWVVSVDNGQGLQSHYTLFAPTHLKAGDRLSKGQVISEEGSVDDVTAQCGAPTGPANSCAIMADNGSTLESGENVMWQNVSMKRGDKIVKADIAFIGTSKPHNTISLRGNLDISQTE